MEDKKYVISYVRLMIDLDTKSEIAKTFKVGDIATEDIISNFSDTHNMIKKESMSKATGKPIFTLYDNYEIVHLVALQQ
jgi:hypothetical protein